MEKVLDLVFLFIETVGAAQTTGVSYRLPACTGTRAQRDRTCSESGRNTVQHNRDD